MHRFFGILFDLAFLFVCITSKEEPLPSRRFFAQESSRSRTVHAYTSLLSPFGHLGGVAGILFIELLITILISSPGATTVPVVIFLIIDAFLLVTAIITQFDPATRRKRLDEVSP